MATDDSALQDPNFSIPGFSHLRKEKRSATLPSVETNRILFQSMSVSPHEKKSYTGEAVKEHKIVLFGAGGVGKTSLVRQFLHHQFNSSYVPTVEDSYRHILQSPDGTCYSLEILDTSGCYSFPAMRELNIRLGNAFVLVFALDNQLTVEEVKTIRAEIVKLKGSKKVPIILVGNKADLTKKRTVKPEEAAQLARDIGARYLETSAKTNSNVYELFSEVVHSYLKADDCSKLVHKVEATRKLHQKRHSDDPQIRLKINNNDCLMALRPTRKKRLSADTAKEMRAVHTPEDSVTWLIRRRGNFDQKLRQNGAGSHHQNHLHMEKCEIL